MLIWSHQTSLYKPIELIPLYLQNVTLTSVLKVFSVLMGLPDTSHWPWVGIPDTSHWVYLPAGNFTAVRRNFNLMELE